MTPFSGPSQRSCESLASIRQNAGEVGRDLRERATDDERAKRLNRQRADFVAAADRERQPVPFETGVGR